jgi:molybdate-binding protein/DNA-binding XRE family transcriptional regulator
LAKRPAIEIENNLGKLRQRRGFSAIDLAKITGVTRQTIYAMEAGTYVPNTAVALRLARALDAKVEDLFVLGDEAPPPDLRAEKVFLLPGSGDSQPGQPVQLCQVDKRLIASPPSAVPWYFPPSDAIVVNEESGNGKIKVRVFHSDREFQNKILLAGCDPGISVLTRHVQAAGVEMAVAHRNSSQALALLKEGCIHVAGTHLRDEASGESNLPEIQRLFPKESVAVISFAIWEEGIIVARGNPKDIKGIEALARCDVLIVNREPGSGSRLLLDSSLNRLKIPMRAVRGYNHIAPGHLPAAWQVHSGAADCCIATRATARAFGLGFVPLVHERYDLAIRRRHLDLPAVQTLLDTLNRGSFRRELEGLGGYDTKAAGQRIL